MASKNSSISTIALILALNLVFFSLVTANYVPTGVTPHTCPIDALKLNVCANLLGGLAGAVIGNPRSSQCCTLIGGLVDLDAAACLCTAIKAQILGINLNVPLSLNVILNACGKKVPEGYKCA